MQRTGKQMKIVERVEGPRANFSSTRRVPMIRMQGAWLEENGFKAGERIFVAVEQGRIVVTLSPEA
ncbi:MAG: SymE family type I addiction module toxin [Thermoanaerobaculia bacterium]